MYLAEFYDFCAFFIWCHFDFAQTREELTTIVYGSPKPKGILEPRSTVEVPLLIQVHELGDHEVAAQFSIFGNKEQLVCVFRHYISLCNCTNKCFVCFLKTLFMIQ